MRQHKDFQRNYFLPYVAYQKVVQYDIDLLYLNAAAEHTLSVAYS
jgi:hypothetical protein